MLVVNHLFTNLPKPGLAGKMMSTAGVECVKRADRSRAIGYKGHTFRSMMTLDFWVFGIQ